MQVTDNTGRTAYWQARYTRHAVDVWHLGKSAPEWLVGQQHDQR